MFETVLRLIALPLADDRIAAAKALPKSQASGIRLWRECMDHGVYSSFCAVHRAVRNILGRYRSVLRYVSRCADRMSLHAASGNSECKND